MTTQARRRLLALSEQFLAKGRRRVTILPGGQVMMRTAPRRVETDTLLAWLAEVLKKSEAVHVDLTVADDPSRRFSVQIILHDLPAPLRGLGSPSEARERLTPDDDEKQLEIFGDVA